MLSPQQLQEMYITWCKRPFGWVTEMGMMASQTGMIAAAAGAKVNPARFLPWEIESKERKENRVLSDATVKEIQDELDEAEEYRRGRSRKS